MATKDNAMTHNNASYAIKHNLKRFKKHHKNVSQTRNFNSYIRFHKDYMKTKEKANKLILNGSYKNIRELHSDVRTQFIYGSPNCNDFPNLYYYASKDINKLYEQLGKELLKHLPAYEFYIEDKEELICKSGYYKFKTPNCLFRFYNIDIDNHEICFYFDNKRYSAFGFKNCEEVFKLIENKYEQ